MIVSQNGGDDQFSAIHFAAYNGNQTLVTYLVSLGADIRLCNTL